MTLSAGHLAGLVAAAFVAGMVDAVAGGGGLITVPALLLAGLPVQFALGTNKGQSVFGSGAALARFARAKMVNRRRAQLTFPLAFVGSLLGVRAVLLLDPALLRPVVLVLLVASAAFLAIRRPTQAPDAGGAPSGARAQAIAGAIALGIGAYDGFFGPGTGTFLIVAFVGLLQVPLAFASADAKVVNFASNLAALLLFASRGLVLWEVALPMALAQLTGALAGAQLAIRGGDRLVRKVVLGVVFALAIKLARDLYLAR